MHRGHPERSEGYNPKACPAGQAEGIHEQPKAASPRAPVPKGQGRGDHPGLDPTPRPALADLGFPRPGLQARPRPGPAYGRPLTAERAATGRPRGREGRRSEPGFDRRSNPLGSD